jgi:hypothetical protein
MHVNGAAAAATAAALLAAATTSTKRLVINGPFESPRRGVPVLQYIVVDTRGVTAIAAKQSANKYTDNDAEKSTHPDENL